MELIRTIILFLVIFGAVVISHEFGHYLIGRKNGIRVVEFAVGMGPTLFSYEKSGIKYSLKALPIGGVCIFDGEDGNFMDEDEEKDPLGNRRKDAVQSEGMPFNEAKVWSRIATVFAGPFFNLILAFMVSLVLVGIDGVDLPLICGVAENTAAEAAGLQEGDMIRRINGERIHFYREVSLASAMNHGETLEIEYERDGQIYSTTIIPKYDQEADRYYIGIYYGIDGYIDCTPIQVFQYSFHEVGYWVKATFKSLAMIFHGQVTKDDVSGPVGIAHFIGDNYEEARVYGLLPAVLTMLRIVILLSVNLGILNLLPLPALDGGRLVFMFVEVFRGKPIPPEKEGMVHFAGLVALMILMVFVMYNDIMKLFH